MPGEHGFAIMTQERLDGFNTTITTLCAQVSSLQASLKHAGSQAPPSGKSSGKGKASGASYASIVAGGSADDVPTDKLDNVRLIWLYNFRNLSFHLCGRGSV